MLCGRVALGAIHFVRLPLLLLLVALIPSLQGFGPVLTKYFTPAKTAWLTIDDGPDPETTPQVLALAGKVRRSGTFFLIGVKAAKYPELARMIVNAGTSDRKSHANSSQIQFLEIRSESSRAGN